jgi:hypothetical protein
LILDFGAGSGAWARILDESATQKLNIKNQKLNIGN